MSRVAIQDLPGRVGTLEIRHPEIHQHHVGLQLAARRTAMRPPDAWATTSMSGWAAEQRRQARAEQVVVVDNQHANKLGL